MQELEALQEEQLALERLQISLEDLSHLSTLADLSAGDLQALNDEYVILEQSLLDWELKTFLNGPYDTHNALITLRSGAGGVDAQDWAEMLLRMYLRYAEQNNLRTRLLDESRGGEAGIKSATIEVIGLYAYGYLRGEAGIHRMVRLSPFNAKSLRQTSFASVEVIPVVTETEVALIKSEELRIDTYRASGAGGQNVNKTESAVRITHIPTGLVAACQSERSQLQNKEEAMRMLRSKIVAKHLAEQEIEKQKLRGEFKSAEWGNQIRSYILHPYTLVKDHRTGTETTNADRVLDGNLESFIQSELRYLHSH